jgi:hypothetical protein
MPCFGGALRPALASCCNTQLTSLFPTQSEKVVKAMPLETASFISQLDASNPAHSDQVNQADSHLRLLKATVKATFPNFTAAALVSTQAQIDAVCSSGLVAISHGQVRGPGLAAVGQFADFPKVPPRLTNGGTAAGGQSAVDWIECDGSVVHLQRLP